jgi:integrase
MPKLAKPLTELEVRRAKPRAKAYMLSDGGGLYLAVSAAGLKSWVVRVRLPGTTTATPSTIGHYPQVTLAEAREKARAAQQSAKVGVATLGLRRAKRAAVATVEAESKAEELATAELERSTFRSVALRWLAENRPRWATETRRKAELIVEKYLIPALGGSDLRTLATKDVRPVLFEMHAKVPQLARKARQHLGKIVDLAIDEGLRGEESKLRLDRILPTTKHGHMPAVTEDESRLAEVMQAIDAYPNRVVRAALVLSSLTAMRSGVVASARWSEIDLDSGEWSVPGKEADGVTNRMKTGKDYSTSLPKQAVEALREMWQRTGGTEFVFPPQARQQSLHLSRDALSKALREMGFQGVHTTHGFRATFRTLGRERLNIPADVLEVQLAHEPANQVQAAYARVKFKPVRRKVMQEWADYLDALRNEGTVVTLRKSA